MYNVASNTTVTPALWRRSARGPPGRLGGRLAAPAAAFRPAARRPGARRRQLMMRAFATQRFRRPRPRPRQSSLENAPPAVAGHGNAGPPAGEPAIQTRPTSTVKRPFGSRIPDFGLAALATLTALRRRKATTWTHWPRPTRASSPRPHVSSGCAARWHPTPSPNSTPGGRASAIRPPPCSPSLATSTPPMCAARSSTPAGRSWTACTNSRWSIA
jgi:hypothetical protein